MKVSASPHDLALAKEFARRLAEQIDPQLFQVTLFGSRARGDADEESDLDLFVALKEDDPQGEVKAIASRIACDLTLEKGILVFRGCCGRRSAAVSQNQKELRSLMDRARRSLRSARNVLDDGDHDFAMSRAYYGMFYAATAALLSQGIKH